MSYVPLRRGAGRLFDENLNRMLEELYEDVGVASIENSTTTPLSASATFTGEWELNESSHVLVNAVADEDGTLYLDFGIPDGAGGVTTTFTQTTPLYADRADFLVAVKGPRYFRVRYVNGGTDQTSFKLLSAFGSNYLPVTASNDNETLVTVTERERDAFVAYQASNVTADTYALLIDLSDTTNFPHDRTGRVDITNTFFSVDRDATAAGSTRIGVITRVDGTDADITYVAGVTFSKSDVRTLLRDRKYSPSQLKLGVVGGALTRIASGFTESNVTAVNMGGTLLTSLGTATPAVGDVIIKFARTAGSYNSAVSVMYHGELEA